MGVKSKPTLVLAMYVIVVIASLGVAKLHASLIGSYDLSSSSRLAWVLFFALLVSLSGYSCGLPDSSALKTPLRSAVIAAVIPPVVLAIIQTAAGRFFLPRFFLGLSIPIHVLVLSALGRVSQIAAKTTAARERVVLLCSHADGELIARDVATHSERSFLLVAVVDPSANVDELPLIDRCLNLDPTTIVFSSEVISEPEVTQTLSELHSKGVRIRDVPNFYDTYIGKIPLRELESTALLFDVGEVHHPAYFRISRMLDIGLGLVGLIALGAILPVVTIGNWWGNRGPLFYRQPRVGKGLQQFQILKFRSMIADDSTAHWTSADDPRVTRFGCLLRRSHMDELPQVINILRGDLSLVGPRPEQPHYVSELSQRIPFYASRHLVRPGLTGWAQVNYPYGADELDAYEKLQFDFWYLRHQRLSIDLKILARTTRHVFGFRGR